MTVRAYELLKQAEVRLASFLCHLLLTSNHLLGHSLKYNIQPPIAFLGHSLKYNIQLPIALPSLVIFLS